MPFHKHLKLPPYKITKRCGAEVEVRSIHRSCSSPRAQAQESPVELGVTEEICSAECLVPFRESDAEPHSFSEPTEHELQSKASVAGWNKLRKPLILTAIETSAMPVDQICLICGEIAVFCCQECGPLVYFATIVCLPNMRRHIFFTLLRSGR